MNQERLALQRTYNGLVNHKLHSQKSAKILSAIAEGMEGLGGMEEAAIVIRETVAILGALAEKLETAAELTKEAMK